MIKNQKHKKNIIISNVRYKNTKTE